jgi:hypothetical protein
MVLVIVKDSLVYGVDDREKKTIYVIGQISMVLTHFKTMVGSCLPAVVNRRNNVLFTLFVFACVYFSSTHTVLGFCFAFLRLVYPMLPVSLCFCYVCHRLVYPMLPVSLDCLFFDCPFGILCANGLSHPYAILLIKLERGGVNNHVVVLPSFLDANVF